MTRGGWKGVTRGGWKGVTRGVMRVGYEGYGKVCDERVCVSKGV